MKQISIPFLILGLFAGACGDNKKSEPAPEPPEDVEVTVDTIDRETLACAPLEEGQRTEHATLADGRALVSIVMNSPCLYQLYLESASGELTALTQSPVTLFNPVVVESSSGPAIFYSHIEHNGWTAQDNGEFRTTPTSVSIRGTMVGEGAGQWQTLASGTVGMWIDHVEALPSGELRAYYMQDSLYEPYFLSQEGRPDTDGRYRLDFTVAPTNAAQNLGAPMRVSGYVIIDLESLDPEIPDTLTPE